MRRLLPLCVLLAACSTDPLPPTPATQIPEVTYGDLAAVGRVAQLDAPLGANRVGVLLTLRDADLDAPALEARGWNADGEPTPWVPVEVTWREGGQLVGRAELGELSYRAELRLPDDAGATIAQLTWSALVPRVAVEPEAPRGDVGRRREALRADIAALGVHAREEWGARATTCSTRNDAKDKIAIHHTVSNPMNEPMGALRGIQSYHMDTRGWCDVGYHFLVSLDGRVWEGRPIEYLGAHVGGHNTGNIGVSFIGCFHPSGGCESFPPQVPPDEMVAGGADVVAGLAGIYDIPINATTVKGHRDHSGASTSCPGDHLHARLDDIRNDGMVTPTSSYGAAFVQQSFPLASQPFELAPLEEVSGFFELRNTGTEPWAPGETFLAPTPRDVASELAGPGWSSTTRAATVEQATAPGEVGRFSFTVKAPRDPGTYPQFFGLVQEGVAWFSDPGHRGPPDDQLELRVTVLDAPPWTGDPDAGASAPDAGVTAGDAGPEMGDGGCDCRAAPGPRDRGPIGLAFLALALLARRRRS